MCLFRQNKGARNLFSLCADACEGGNEIVRRKKSRNCFRPEAVARAATDLLVIGR